MLDLAAPAAHDLQVLEPSLEPRHRRCGHDELPRVRLFVDLLREFSELGAIDDTAVLEWIDHGEPSAGTVADTDEESSRQVDSEGFEADPFRGSAIDERTRKWQSWNAPEHEFQVHSIGMQRYGLGSTEADLFEEGLVEMGQHAVHRSRLVWLASSRQMGDPGPDPVREAFDKSVARIPIDLGASMAPDRHDGSNKVVITIQVGQRVVVSGRPVGHGSSGCPSHLRRMWTSADTRSSPQRKTVRVVFPNTLVRWSFYS